MEPRIRLVRRLPPSLRTRALADTLSVCSPAEADAFAPELVELAIPPVKPEPTPWLARLNQRLAEQIATRRHERARRLADTALAEVARLWERMPLDVRASALAAGSGRWERAVRALSNDDSTRTRRALAQLALDSHDPALAPTLVGTLSDSDERTASLAARALAELGESALRALESADRPARCRPALRALTLAAEDYARHTRRELLSVLLRLADTPGRRRAHSDELERLGRLVRDPGHPASKALRGELRWSRLPGARARAWEWVVEDSYGAASIDRLSRAPTVGDHEAVLTRSQLALNPRRRERVRMIEAVRRVRTESGEPAEPGIVEGGALPTPDRYPELSVDARRGLPRVLRGFRVRADARALVLSGASMDADAIARHNSVRALAPADLAVFCTDQDERVAHTAALRRSRPGAKLTGARPDDWRGLLGSAHQRLRAIAQDELASVDPWMSRSVRTFVAARRSLARDRAAFIAECRGRFSGGEVVQSLLLVERLGIAGELREEIIGSCEDAQSPGDTAATAVSVLSRLNDNESRAAVERCVGHDDRRVRANAVEGLARMTRRAHDLASEEPGVYGVLIEHKDDNAHRVRANALVGLLSARPEAGVGVGERIEIKRARVVEPAAAESLAAMLADGRPMHRLAGLWAGERLLGGLTTELSHDVVAMMEQLTEDADERVRRRAERCRARLVGARIGGGA